MNNNIINIQFNGRLELLGQTSDSAIFSAKGVSWHGEENLDWMARKPLRFRAIDHISETVIFEYPIEGPIRNPRKLLKSVRKKLMNAILDAASENAPDWWPEDSNSYSGDQLVNLSAKWYQEYIAPFSGRH